MIPPFTAAPELGGAGSRVMVVEHTATVDDGLPRGVRTAGGLGVADHPAGRGGHLVIRVVGLLRVVVIPVVVALLLAAMFQPAAAGLRKRGMNRSLAAGLVLLASLLVVFGGLALIVRTFIAQLDDLSAPGTPWSPTCAPPCWSPWSTPSASASAWPCWASRSRCPSPPWCSSVASSR
ncbi:hypothetical protein ACGFJ7_20850 [Actinoplanes sp. NPDC048988]|uniref:hypothetical protein n=1 Tax=Actinoplanes sp. NPDC048988 TaxID=3363901 RepID=UPI00370FF557